jgi:tetratricopeptide (TPR) repeat protein
MADYDTALDLDPNNFLGHYNRGLLRAQVGDDNRGIEDFDFVLRLEPDNLMALFNRGLLRDKTGDVRGAIRDYSEVIRQYPNFWTGLQYRAQCYRRLGMNRQAELDEFRILKAQMDKRYGKPTKPSKPQTRKRSDEDLEKYNQLVVADEEEVDNEYKNDYRGRVQNHKVEMSYMPMYELAMERPHSEIHLNISFNPEMDAFNRDSQSHPIFISCHQATLNEGKSQAYFAFIDSLSAAIEKTHDMKQVSRYLLLRAVAYSSLQNYDSAIDDLSSYLQLDSTSALAYWQRAACQSRLNEFHASQGLNIDMKRANVLSDLTKAISYSPSNAYLYYNLGNLSVQRKDYRQAIADYTRAIDLDSELGEAYYNRGLAYLDDHQTAKGIADLSKAGELGLYTAYSIIKKYSK